MLDWRNKTELLVLAGLGCGLALATVVWNYRQKKKRWVLVGHVEKLWLFPLKSGAPLETDCLFFDSMGPKKGEIIDRGFAVANKGTYTIKDQHSYSKLCLVSLDMAREDDITTVTLSSPESEHGVSFSLPTEFSKEPEERFVSTSIIRGAVSSVYDCGEAPAAWLSNLFKQDVSGLRLLFHYKKESVRTHSTFYLKPFGKTMRSTHLPALSNVAPYHMVTSSSVNELNKQLSGEEATTALSFRPNLVVKTLTDQPYQEDGWIHGIRIGDEAVELEFSLPNDRCSTVNVDQNTGQRDGQQILKWLEKNRRTLDDKAEKMFGGPQGVFGHRYGLKEGTKGEVKMGHEVWAFM